MSSGGSGTPKFLSEDDASLVWGILREVPDPLFVKDHDHRFVFFNEAFCRFVRHAPHDLLGKSDYDFFPKEQADVFWAKDEEVFHTRAVVVNEEALTDGDGNSLIIVTKKYCVMSPSGDPLLVGIIHDVTKERAAEAALRAERDKAEQALQAKREFLAKMSHEIRTPMNGIIGMIECLLDLDLQGEHRDYATTVHSSASSLLGVINDILDFSKIEAGRIELDPQDISLSELLFGVQKTLSSLLIAKQIELMIDIDRTIPEFIKIDENRLRQVLLNLVGNSVKFSSFGGCILLTVRADPDREGVVHFGVLDNGIGIQHEAQAAIFEPFAQADTSMNRKYGGTGLGLTIAAELVELLGGCISVSSKEAVGTIFQFSVRFAQAGPVATPVNERRRFAHLGKSGDTNGPKILVAEDNSVNQKLIRLILEREGFEIVIAANGREVIERHYAEEFALILMDIQMPIMGGEEATRIIRGGEVRNSIPILALTAHALVGEREKFLALGMNSYITKPIDRKVLFRELDRFLPR